MTQVARGIKPIIEEESTISKPQRRVKKSKKKSSIGDESIYPLSSDDVDSAITTVAI